MDEFKSTIGGLKKKPHFVNYGGMADDPQYVDIGLRLKALRETESELSQKDWAERHGFNKTQYNNWEKGTRRIPVEAAELLSDKYGLTLDVIYRGRVSGLSETAKKIL